MTQVTVNGQDISERIIAYNLDNAFAADSQIRVAPVDITVNNNDGAYLRTGRAHLSPDIDLTDIAVTITHESGAWSGTLAHIDTHKPGVAVLTAESSLARIMATPVALQANRYTPAGAIIMLVESVGLEAGVGLHIAAREQVGLSINALIGEADNIALSQALSAIADLASMRLIVTDTGIDAAAPHTDTPYWVLRSRDVIAVQSYNRLRSYVGFSVGFVDPGNVPAIGGAKLGDIFSAECGASSWLQINDYTTALALGNMALMRSRWSLVVVTRRDAVYAAPGSVLHADIAEIGLDAPTVVTGVHIDNAWQTITLEERVA